jgi:ATP-dependent exoDNAse (exonuclease V) beta subunit
MNDRAALQLQDAAARTSALDITRSWLVQAPAGSGKTELLIARFLALLAHVERPERIVATTFTRKAAAEMRERVIGALREVQSPARTPRSEHEASLRRLAAAALAQDRRMGWRLLEQPARLRIVTIDALAAAIARQAPLAARLGALPGFVDDAQALYRDAARAALESAPADDPHWRAFLQWQDNDAAAVTRLIAQLLGARDRWPHRMLDEDADALRADMERALALEAQAAICVVRERIPASLAQALPALAAMALDHFRANDAAPTFGEELEVLARDRVLPGTDARDAWCALADWVLTKRGTFVKAITVDHGFPGKGNGHGALERAQRKDAFRRWLLDAAAVPGLAEAWHRLRQLPPARFDDAAWVFVVAVMNVLPQAVEALDAQFGARGQADFPEATLRALRALGSDDEPSELLLAIDYRLAHLLIDEFQDTSRAQLALIARLTEGWQPGDGRTLFAVGDPMQSIYRFRQAEVGIFLNAQQGGSIGSVEVGVVDLARNFRSQRAIVEWVNDVFGAVLPPVSDASRSEAAYCAAYADSTQAADIAPTLDLVASRDAEAAAVVSRVAEARIAGAGTIAVLVRARTHAEALLPARRRAGMAYSAVDLEGLHDRLATRDLLALARALAQPADRLAWLAILHAPWCGLGLRDLLVIADASRAQPIVEAIARDEVVMQLPAASRERVAHLRYAIEPALVARGQASFARRVRGAWLALGGPACAGGALDRDGVDRVFALLAEHEHAADLHDFDALWRRAEQLFAEAGAAQGAAVQVMTLHRAKGLQFDAVILPGLDQATGGGEPPLLRWKVREHGGVPTLLLAPMRARGGATTEDDAVYRWLGKLDAAEDTAELGRLLYVGATRARRRLHLIGVASVEPAHADGAPCWKRPARGTPLEQLWDALAARLPDPRDATPARSAQDTPGSSAIEWSRLPDRWCLPSLPPALPVASLPVSAPETIAFDWADVTAAAIGTVAHRLLAQVAFDGLDAWHDARPREEWDRITAELGGEGVEPDQREDAARRVVDIVMRTLRDPRGRWLFDAAHEDAHSEWALSGEDEGRIVHVVLDRSFVASGCRYIIDFKTGAHEGADAAAFLAREFQRYQAQLAQYARIVAAFDPRPIRIALYHPLVDGGWQESGWSLQ